MEMFEKQARIRTKKITRKRGKCEEEKDRISGLPDCILVEILSRLPDTKEAIRTGTLSKRWKHVWTYVFNLTFHFCNDAAVHMLSNFVSSVDKTLTQCRQLKLNKFQLYTVCDAPFVSQVNNWIRYAFDCKVEELDLRIWPPRDLKLEFSLHYLFYMNSRFRDLKVTGPVLNPTGAISWKQLRSLCISEGKLDEDLIENILSGSPLLETLELEACHGYSRLDITSKSVKNLVFSGYWGPQYDDYDEEYFDDYFSDDDAYDEEYFDDYFSDDDAYDDFISINAPCILSLTIKSYVKLGKLLLLDVSSLVKAELCYTTGGLNGTPKKAEEEMLKGFILDLHHVEELQIGVPCIKALSCLEAKGFIIPSNLKVSDVT